MRRRRAEVIGVDLQTWVSLCAIAGFGTAVLGSLRSFRAEILAELHSEVARLERGSTELRTELKGDLTGLRTELKRDLTGLRTELKGDLTGGLASLRAELKGAIADHRAESRAGFAEVNRRLSVLEDRTYDLASRLPPPPAHSVSGT